MSNALILSILNELYEDAKENKKDKLIFTLNKAIRSLKKYPLPIRNGQEASILEGIGSFISNQIDLKLKSLGQFGSCETKLSSPLKRSFSESEVIFEKENLRVNKRTKNKLKEWIPKNNSGAWAILIALFQNTEENEYLDVDVLKRLANPLSSTSMYPDTNKKYGYCAWSNHAKLIEHGYIIRKLKPTRFCLSEQGRQMAQQLSVASNLVSISTISQSQPTMIHTIDSQFSSQVQDCLFSENHFTSIVNSRNELLHQDSSCRQTKRSCKFEDLFEGKYSIETIEDVFIVIDNREKKSRDEKYFEDELNKRNIPAYTRQLSIGDFVWVGRTKEGNEVILDAIIERKRIDDLCSSIISKRYSEQKWRLSHSGIKSVIYLIEGSINAWGLRQSHTGNLTVNNIEMALLSTHSIDEFTVMQCLNSSSTVTTISKIYEHVNKSWRGRSVLTSSLDAVLFVKGKHDGTSEAERQGHNVINEKDVVFTYSQFQEHNAKIKVLPIRDTFGLQLMACNRCSADAAVAIVNAFKTPCGLAKQYHNASNDEDRKSLLKSIKMTNNRSIGKQLSLNIWDSFWGR